MKSSTGPAILGHVAATHVAAVSARPGVLMMRFRIRGAPATIRQDARGHVTVVFGDKHVTVIMDAETRVRISAMSYEEHFKPWRAEMERLQQEAIKRARKGEWD